MVTDLNLQQAFKNAAFDAAWAVGTFGASLAVDAYAVAEHLPVLIVFLGLPLLGTSATAVYEGFSKFANGLNTPVQNTGAVIKHEM